MGNDKMKIQIEKEVANRLKAMGGVGVTYSDTIKRLLDEHGKGVA